MANINGTGAGEPLTGTADDDVINGKTPPVSGSDTVTGLGGADVLYGGVESGDTGAVDRLDGGDGNDVIHFDVDRVDGLTSASLLGGAGDDAISLTQISATSATPTGAITVDGGAGTDTLTISGAVGSLLSRLTLTGLEQLTISGATIVPLSTEQLAGVAGHISFTDPYDSGYPYSVTLIDGGVADFSASQVPSGLSVMLASGASTTVTGGDGPDSIFGGDYTTAANVRYLISGAEGNDALSLGSRGAAADSLYGGPGDDSLMDFYNARGDLLDGGAGFDKANINLTEGGGLTLRFADFATTQGVTFADHTTIRNVEQVSLTLTGDNDVAYMGADGGYVDLTGLAGKAYSGLGNDTLDAADVYVTPGGRDSADGVFNHIDYASAAAAVHMNSTTTHSRAGDYYINEAWVGGTPFSDTGSSASVIYFGRAEVFGSAFGDWLVADQHVNLAGSYEVDLYGGSGNDTIFAGPNGAVLAGGNGIDTLDFSKLGMPSGDYGAPPAMGITVDLSVTGGQGTGYGADTITGVENVVGTTQADQIAGDGGSNLLNGAAGNDTLSGGAGNDSLAGGLGNDVLFGGDGDDTAVFNFAHTLAGFKHVGATLVVSGPDGSDTLSGIEHLQFADGVFAPGVDGPAPSPDAPETIGGSSVVGGSGSDSISGTYGDDTIQGGPGSDTINAGTGDDTAVYLGRSLFYQVTSPAQAGFGSFYVAGGDEGGIDNLGGVDNLRFLDGTLTFDPNSAAAEIYRLYDTFLNRAPDVAGFDAFQQYLASGHTLTQAAAIAGSSPEFRAATSGLSNADYVTYLYENTVDRTPDAYGLQQYTALLDGGESRVDLALQISEGAEHVNDTNGAVYAGLWTPDVQASGLALLYDAVLQREPDAYGLPAYEAELNDATTFRQIANQATSSPEFQARYGELTDKQFIDELYLNTVHRAADPYGENAYLQELQHGYTRGDVIWQVSISAEHESYVLSHPDPSLFTF